VEAALQAKIREVLRRLRQRRYEPPFLPEPGTPERIVAVFKIGGHGDKMALAALAQAVKREHPDALVLMVSQITGATADFDIGAAVKERGIEVLLLPTIEDKPVLEILRAECDVVYHMPGYVAAIYRNGDVANAAKLHYTVPGENSGHQLFCFYYGFPWSQRWLTSWQWDLLSLSTGLTVSPWDMCFSDKMPGIDLRRAPESVARERAKASWERARLRGVRRYVVVHNSAGGGGRVKQIPPATFEAAIRACKKAGFRVVQVGRRQEERWPGVIDRRGFRWPITGRLIREADAYLGPEGGLAYLAALFGTPAFIFFGPTPRSVFDFPNNVRVNTQDKCSPCWWSAPGWAHRCRRGYEWCQNMPSPQEIEQRLAEILPTLPPARERTAERGAKGPTGVSTDGRRQGCEERHGAGAVPVRA